MQHTGSPWEDNLEGEEARHSKGQDSQETFKTVAPATFSATFPTLPISTPPAEKWLVDEAGALHACGEPDVSGGAFLQWTALYMPRSQEKAVGGNGGPMPAPCR